MSSEAFDLGTVKVNQVVIFYAMPDELEKINNIKEFKYSCNCFKAKVVNNSVQIKFTAPDIPRHLKSQGYYTTSKTLTIVYEDGSLDTINFKARVTK